MEARPAWPLGGRGALAAGSGTVDIMAVDARAVLLEGWDVGDGMKARAAGAVAARASRKASGRRRGIVVVAGVDGLHEESLD